jgi:hypothetical protein
MWLQSSFQGVCVMCQKDKKKIVVLGKPQKIGCSQNLVRT